MSGRFARSWSLVKASMDVLRMDKELMIFPLCSAIASLLVLASFLIPLFALRGLETMDEEGVSAGWMVWAFLFYLTQYFVIFYFNSALVGAAMIRLNGGDPTVGDGLRIANGKLGPILGYAFIAATVGLILRAIEERAGWIGRWIAGLLGVAFSIATFLTVPVLVSRDIGPLEAVKESASLLKKTWGENIIGNGGLGLTFVLIYVLMGVVSVLVIIGAASLQSPALIGIVVALAVIAFIVTALVHGALQGIYAAALYRYATEGESPSSFSADLLGNAFRLKA